MVPASIAAQPADTAEPRIVIVTGSYPPDVCGVGDYTDRLMKAAPRSWHLFVQHDWSARAARAIISRLLPLCPSHVVIQYPTQGYGWSLVPHLLIITGWLTRRYCPIFALHEFTSLSQKSRFMLAIASHFAAHIIFTTEAERDRARAYRLFSSTVPTSVIGILSNIPLSDATPAFAARAIDIAYFGHIRPNKGIEDFLDVMAALRATQPSASLAVIGEIPTGYEAFGEMVAARCRDIGCDLVLGLDDEAAGRQLGDIRILYLPFRDGVSARRGSVLAGMGNGALIATRIGETTPDTLRTAVIACTGSIQDIPLLQRVLCFRDEEAAELQRVGRDYIATMLPRDWAHVAALYAQAITGCDPETSRC